MYTVVHDGEIIVVEKDVNKIKMVVREKSNDWGKVEVASFCPLTKQWIAVNPIELVFST